MKTRELPKTAMGQIAFLLEPYRWQVLLSIFLVILPGYFTVWQPYIIGRLIDDGLMQKDVNLLWQLGLLILSIKVALFFFNSGVTYCLSAFGLQILVDYRDKLLSRVLRYPIKFFDRISAGTLTTRLTTDINSVQEMFSTALVPIIGNLFLVLGVFVSMFIINWELALVASIVVPFLIWLNVVFDVRIRRRFGFMRKALSSLSSFSAEVFGGVRDVKVLAATPMIQDEFDSHSRRLREKNTRAVREYALFNPTVPFITALMDVLILGYGGWKVYSGTMSVGEVVAFLGYAALFAWPIRDFAEKYTVLQQALAAIDRLVEVSTYEFETDDGTLSHVGRPFIRFENVSFSYKDSHKRAVSDLSFEAPAGSKIALLGETGSGKTTTCALLMRFYEKNEGRILIDGKAIEELSLDAYRAQIGWVSQDVFLFSASLRENLTFHSNVTDEEIWNVLELVQLKKWVKSLPNELNEVLEERASSISSGQRQLLSLARALLRKPKILIFDEATSAVDSLTELLFQRALEKLWESDALKDTTCFFIAHRLSTLRRCDQMLVYRDGKIVERGTFEELMKIDGYAAHLFKEQFKRLAV